MTRDIGLFLIVTKSPIEAYGSSLINRLQTPEGTKAWNPFLGCLGCFMGLNGARRNKKYLLLLWSGRPKMPMNALPVSDLCMEEHGHSWNAWKTQFRFCYCIILVKLFNFTKLPFFSLKIMFVLYSGDSAVGMTFNINNANTQQTWLETKGVCFCVCWTWLKCHGMSQASLDTRDHITAAMATCAIFWGAGQAIGVLCLSLHMMMSPVTTDSSASGKSKAKAEIDSLFQLHKFLESNVSFYLTDWAGWESLSNFLSSFLGQFFGSNGIKTTCLGPSYSHTSTD